MQRKIPSKSEVSTTKVHSNAEDGAMAPVQFKDQRPETKALLDIQACANSFTHKKNQPIQRKIDIQGTLANEGELDDLNQENDVTDVLRGWITDGSDHVFRDWVHAIVRADKLLEYQRRVQHYDSTMHHSSSITPHLPHWFADKLEEVEDHIYDCLGSKYQEFTFQYIEQEMKILDRQMDRAVILGKEDRDEKDPSVAKKPAAVINAIAKEALASGIDYSVRTPQVGPPRFDTGYYGHHQPNARIKTEDLAAVKAGWKAKVLASIHNMDPIVANQMRDARSGSNPNVWDFQIQLYYNNSWRPVFNFHIIYQQDH